MKMAEVPMNLLTVPQGWYVAYATSADLRFSYGLPKLINEYYHVEYKMENASVGDAVLSGNLISLFVKQKETDKPDESDLYICLQNLNDLCIKENITKLAIPKICCGNNGLIWKDVKKAIRNVFNGSNIFILVCI